MCPAMAWSICAFLSQYRRRSGGLCCSWSLGLPGAAPQLRLAARGIKGHQGGRTGWRTKEKNSSLEQVKIGRVQASTKIKMFIQFLFTKEAENGRNEKSVAKCGLLERDVLTLRSLHQARQPDESPKVKQAKHLFSVSLTFHSFKRVQKILKNPNLKAKILKLIEEKTETIYNFLLRV